MAHGVWKDHPFVKKNDPDENFNRSINLKRSRMKPAAMKKPNNTRKR